MFYILMLIAATCLSFCAGVYGLYFFLVFRTAKKNRYLKLTKKALETELPPHRLPMVSILMPVYNEAEVISRKIQSIAALDYPHERIEIVIVDDGSTDRTVAIAQRMFHELNLPGRIIRNGKRMGVNASYNRGVEESKGDWILTTDADVTFDHDALAKAVKILNSLEDVGGISAKMIPVSSDRTAAVSIERAYNPFYQSMLLAESAMYSTFPAYSPFMLLKKSAFSPLPPMYGSSDGNISLATIKKGLRFLYVPDVWFYEPVPIKVTEQRRQKIRRARRLVQSTLANRDLLFDAKYKSFGKIIFPLRFAMMVLCPIALTIGFMAMVLGAIYVSAALPFFLLFVFLSCTFLGMKYDWRTLNVFSSFVAHQFYLLVGLLLSQKGAAAWKPPERSEMTIASSEMNP